MPEVEEDLVYFDELEGIYYDRNGNPIEFNPDDFIIEEMDGTDEIFKTVSERPKSAMPTPSTHSRTLSEYNENKRRKLRARKAKKKSGVQSQAGSKASGTSYIS